MTEPQFCTFLKKFQEIKYDFIPFEFEFSYATTREFSQWWELQYGGHVVNELLLLDAVTNGFKESILNQVKSRLNARGITSVFFYFLCVIYFTFETHDHLMYFLSSGAKSKVVSINSNQPSIVKIEAGPSVSLLLFAKFSYLCSVPLNISMPLLQVVMDKKKSSAPAMKTSNKPKDTPIINLSDDKAVFSLSLVFRNFFSF
jgi:hypothetical protein